MASNECYEKSTQQENYDEEEPMTDFLSELANVEATPRAKRPFCKRCRWEQSVITRSLIQYCKNNNNNNKGNELCSTDISSLSSLYVNNDLNRIQNDYFRKLWLVHHWLV